MIEVLSKPADQIRISDIKSLIDSLVPESEQIEFKESLPARKNSTDPWIEGNNTIGNQAKDKILEEVVAFANAYGGVCLLGIKESSTKPPVAAEISPIPRCAELAERLKLVFSDCVEPQLPQIEIIPIKTDGESGVIIIRVGQSRLAPHRVTRTLVCPIRQSDRCEKMTMRQIQDLTLNISRGLERLERRLSERSERFQHEFERINEPEKSFGIRATAMETKSDLTASSAITESLRISLNHGYKPCIGKTAPKYTMIIISNLPVGDRYYAVPGRNSIARTLTLIRCLNKSTEKFTAMG